MSGPGAHPLAPISDHRYTIPVVRMRPAANYRPKEEHMDPAPDRPAPDGETEQRTDEARPPPKDEETPRATGQDANQPTDGDAHRPTDDDADQPTDQAKHRPTEQRADQRTDDAADRQPDQRRDGATGERTDERSGQTSNEADPLLQELVAYLRERRTELREEWARRISEAELLGVMSDDEIFSEATEVYDNYVDALETGSIETLQSYARELSERIIPRGVETHEVLGIVLLLRDVLARSLFAKYQKDLDLLNRILNSYEPAANRIAVTVGVSFVEERERVIHEQQEAMRELSTPVLQLREHLLILPIIGALDSSRARQLTEQLLGAIQERRATVVVIDITGVATIDRTVANHLVQTVEASRLMGASTILTGLSSEIAQTLVDLDVDLSMMKTVGDLQGGLVEAERLAGQRGGDASDSTDFEF
jgi:rsbT co-antagonist protein RsbR